MPIGRWVQLEGGAKDVAELLGVVRVHVSIAHEDEVREEPPTLSACVRACVRVLLILLCGGEGEG